MLANVFLQKGYINNAQTKTWRRVGRRIDGGQAEYVNVPFADNGLTIIPDNITDEQALFNGDILSTGFWAARLGEIRPADTVAVIGAGPTGLCTMMCAKLYTPARIIAIDIDEHRLALAKEKGLADVTLTAGKDDIEAAVFSLTEDGALMWCLKQPAGGITFQTAWKTARPNATAVIVLCMKNRRCCRSPTCTGKILSSKQAEWTEAFAEK